MTSKNKDQDLLDIIEKFTQRELAEVLIACGSGKRSTKDKCVDAIKGYLKGEKRQAAIDKMMEISELKFDKNDKELVAAKAKKITDDLDPNKPPIDFDKESRMQEPDQDGMRLFERVFKATCHDKLNPIKDRKIFVAAWESLGDEKSKWKAALDRLNKLYQEYLDNKGDIADDRQKIKIKNSFFCPFCYATRTGFDGHFKIHFPKHADPKTPEIATEMNILLDMIKKDNEYSDKVHKLALDFWKALWSDKMSRTDLKLFNKVKKLYESMMEGNKEHKLYFLIQLINDYELISADKLLQVIIRYNGKASKDIRHFGLSKSHGIAGNVGREIAKIINIHQAGGDIEIQEMDRLYAWDALNVPTESSVPMEQAFTLALWHLTKRSSGYWNMQITAIKPDNKFADVHPEMLILVGMYALWQITQRFSVQSVKTKSDELLDIYDRFTDAQRKSFDKKYGIVKSDDRDVLIDLLTKALQNVQLTTKAHGFEKLDSILAHPQLQALMNPTAQDGDIGEEGDFEDGESSED